MHTKIAEGPLVSRWLYTRTLSENKEERKTGWSLSYSNPRSTGTSLGRRMAKQPTTVCDWNHYRVCDKRTGSAGFCNRPSSMAEPCRRS
jgi:hypothetical protein